MPKRKFSKKRAPARKPLKKRSYKKRAVTKRTSRYRRSVPRYLELAHFKPKQKTVRFTWAKEWYIVPKLYSSPTGAPATVIKARPGFLMQFRANSICSIGCIKYDGSVDSITNKCWDEQNDIAFTIPSGPISTMTQPPGYGRYMSDYRHFTVVGSTIDVTAQPNGLSNSTGAEKYLPSVLTVIKTGNSHAVIPADQDGYDINTPADMSRLQRLPYKQTAAIQYLDGTKAVGGRVSQTYSAKKFEGITDIKDNNQFRGLMGMPAGSSGLGPTNPINPQNPSEMSYFSVVYGTRMDGRKNYDGVLPDEALAVPVTLRVRMSYIVKLTEPTWTGAHLRTS